MPIKHDNIPHIDQETISAFLEGKDPQQYITALEYEPAGNYIHLIIDDPVKGKFTTRKKLKPFLWCKEEVFTSELVNFYGRDRRRIKNAMKQFGVKIKKLNTADDERLDNGYKYLVYTNQGFYTLLKFFGDGGIQPYKNREYFELISPVEQYMISTGKRLFKGFDNYDDVHRMVFDIETTSLEPSDGRIFSIGVKDNRGFEVVLDADNEDEEKEMIVNFFKVIDYVRPSIIGGYNSENFDWYWIVSRCEMLGLDIKEIAKTLDPKKKSKFRRRENMLKLANEVERFEQTSMWGYNIIDVIHSVRRAMAINSNIKSAGLKYICKQQRIAKDNRVYVDHDKIAKLRFDTNPYWINLKTGEWSESSDDIIPEGWEEITGKEIIEKYLLDDIWETLEVDNSFNQSSFLMAKILPTIYERVSTMGTASIWKLLMLSWSYENGLAVPEKGEKRSFTGGLSRILKVGYSKDIVKLDYASLYPSIMITHGVYPDCDVSGAMHAMLQYLYDTRNKYKYKANECAQEGDKKMASFFKAKQLPIKIINNSMYGSLTAPQVFNWGDVMKGEEVTCTARMYLRLMVRFFENRGFIPIVLDTDGCNFSVPESTNKYNYVGKGIHHFVEKGKEYTGTAAVVAEFNDTYMRGVMGLDIDGFWKSSINVSRKNYADLTEDGKVDIVGNTIKSKALPDYIKEFIDLGLEMLLNGRGPEFVEYYYEHLQNIYDCKIPLKKIASKSRIKRTIKSYVNRGNNKAGNPLPSQAHMELVIKHNVRVSLGDVIYYVNNGTRASHGDIQKKKGILTFNCYMLDKDQMENNPDICGEYNKARYISNFNKRVKPLLVSFTPEIRDSILKAVDKKGELEPREYYTKTQMGLISGIPFTEKDQDTIEDLMKMDEREDIFWKDINSSPKESLMSVLDLKNN